MARKVAWLAALLTVLSLVLLPWWPEGTADPLFLEFRSSPLKAHAESGAYAEWYNAIPLSYFSFGYLIHIAAAVAAPLLLARPDRWRWFTVAVPVTTLWQFIAVVPFGLVNTTIVPYLPMIAGVVTCVCWVAARVGGRDQVSC